MKQDLQRKLVAWALVVGLTFLAGALRLPALGSAPPGLYHDEAFNGLDALGVLNGNWQIYFAANHGREPIYIYLVAIAVGLFGSTPFAVRLPAAIIGTLTIPATYWMVRHLWGRRVGLLAAAIMAVTLWPVHLSRIGLRAVTLPFFAALGIGLTVRAWRSGLRRDWLIAGATWGLASYTYLAVRFTPLVFVLFVLFMLIFRRIEAGPFLPDRLSIGAVWATVGFGLVVAPLVIYTLGHWDVVMARPGGVSIFEPGINRGDLPGALIGNTLKALGLFVWQGDRIPRHNAPWRPVFDPLLAAAFIVGLVVMLRQTRQRIAAMFALLWLGVMLLPTILAEDAPHFLRAVGVLPVAMIFPALGLDWIGEKISTRSRAYRRPPPEDKSSGYNTAPDESGLKAPFTGRRTGSPAINRRADAIRNLVLITVVGLSAGFTLRDYLPYSTSAETGYAFEAGAVELASEINRLDASGHRVLMDERYLSEWTAILFILRKPPDVVLHANTELPTQPVSPALLVTWPYADWSARLAAWPAPMQVRVQAGPRVKGDRDPQPYSMAVLAQIEPRAGLGNAAEATFDGDIRLLGHAIEDRGDEWLLRTLWHIERPVTGDVTLFVHLLNAGAVALNADGDVGDGLYPMRLWRIGDVIVDERRLRLPAGVDRPELSMEIGLYDRPSGDRVNVIDSRAPISNDALQLGAPGSPGP